MLILYIWIYYTRNNCLGVFMTKIWMREYFGSVRINTDTGVKIRV